MNGWVGITNGCRGMTNGWVGVTNAGRIDEWVVGSDGWMGGIEQLGGWE